MELKQEFELEMYRAKCLELYAENKKLKEQLKAKDATKEVFTEVKQRKPRTKKEVIDNSIDA